MAKQGFCAPAISPNPQITTANNTFSQNASIALSDVNATGGSGFTYSYRTGIGTGANLQEPLYISSNITKVGCSFISSVDYSTACPSNLVNTGNGGGGSGNKLAANTPFAAQQAIQNKFLADSIQTVINSLKTKANALGNGNNLLLKGFNKAAYLAHSPYLNDTNLLQLLQMAPSPSDSDMAAILVANSPLTPAVLTYVKSMGMAAGITKIVENAQYNTNAKVEQELLQSYYASQKELAVNTLVRFYLHDSTAQNINKSIKWLKWNNTPQDNSYLLAAYCVTKDFKKANNILDSLAQDTSFAPTHQYYSLLANSQLADSSYKQQIEKIAKDINHPNMGNALAALRQTDSTIKNYLVIERAPADSLQANLRHAATKTQAAVVLPVKQIQAQVLQVKVYPNPASNLFYIHVPAKQEYTAYLSNILTGSLLQTQIITEGLNTINIEKYAPGTYVLKLLNKEQATQYFKILKLNNE